MSAVPNRAAAEIERIDRAIIGLLLDRCAIAREMPVDTEPRARTFPRSFRISEVTALYRAELGGPGELVARAVLNLCRAATKAHRHPLAGERSGADDT